MRNFRVNIRDVAVWVLLVLMLGSTPLRAAGMAGTQDDAAQETKELRELFAGSLNVYLSVAEVQNNKPSLSNVRFDSVVFTVNAKYMVFTDDKGKWFIETKSVYALRSMPGK